MKQHQGVQINIGNVRYFTYDSKAIINALV